MGTSRRLGLSAARLLDCWGREKRSKLHPEKSWFTVIGRGFDSRHLHPEVFVYYEDTLRLIDEARSRLGAGLFVLLGDRVWGWTVVWRAPPGERGRVRAGWSLSHTTMIRVPAVPNDRRARRDDLTR